MSGLCSSPGGGAESTSCGEGWGMGEELSALSAGADRSSCSFSCRRGVVSGMEQW